LPNSESEGHACTDEEVLQYINSYAARKEAALNEKRKYEGQTFKCFEWAITFTVYLPDHHAVNLNTADSL